ncbi:hypothetical protein MnTg02_03355 [bacterium MnTg02]|nr:hypothetical protein MnTg02_03355 [bacterium MnTg02]
MPANVDDRCNADTGGGKFESSEIGGIVRGDDGRSIADPHAIAVEVTSGGSSEHDARAVIAGKNQRPLDGACRQNNVFGADTPHTLTGQAGRR